jgi:hypothetical protein
VSLEDQSRPGEGGSDKTIAAVNTIIPPAADWRQNAGLLPVDPLDAIAAHVDGTFVIVVKLTGGKYRRRCFMTAASAERAARNALDAGHTATVFLAQLKPAVEAQRTHAEPARRRDRAGRW